MNYLRSFYNGKTVGTSRGDPQIAGRLFYNDDFTAAELHQPARAAGRRADATSSSISRTTGRRRYYIASTTIDACLPGFRQDNDVPFAAHGFDPLASIWIGNRTIASCHYDAPNNLACCAVGKRRFTMFPPEQIFNLYPGPLEPDAGRAGGQPGRFRQARFRTLSALSRGAGRRPGRRSRARRCGVHAEHVVASHRSAEPVQHADQLLVEHRRRSSFRRP